MSRDVLRRDSSSANDRGVDTKALARLIHSAWRLYWGNRNGYEWVTDGIALIRVPAQGFADSVKAELRRKFRVPTLDAGKTLFYFRGRVNESTADLERLWTFETATINGTITPLRLDEHRLIVLKNGRWMAIAEQYAQLATTAHVRTAARHELNLVYLMSGNEPMAAISPMTYGQDGVTKRIEEIFGWGKRSIDRSIDLEEPAGQTVLH